MDPKVRLIQYPVYVIRGRTDQLKISQCTLPLCVEKSVAMGRHKRQQLKPCHSYGLARAVPRTEPLSHSANQKPKRVAPQHNAPAIPFSPDDHILLVGEGDLSFARALVQSLGCLHVTATVLEKDRVELEEKYPHVGTIIDEIENEGGKVEFGVDARRMRRWDINDVDAKAKVKIGVMDKIVFNFPHVGGKSTDVNRQVSEEVWEIKETYADRLGG